MGADDLLGSPSKQPMHAASRPLEKAFSLVSQERYLSPNELSYFLPARAYGLNDVYLSLKVVSTPLLINARRVRIVWAIMRLRHPLLATRVDMLDGDYDSARFVYTPPSSPTDALAQTIPAVQFFYRTDGASIVDAYINGPRVLSAELSANVHVSTLTSLPTANDASPREYTLFLGATHVCMDGLGMHMNVASFLELLGGEVSRGAGPRTDAELEALLEQEWFVRFGGDSPLNVLPVSFEQSVTPYVDDAEATRARDDFNADQARVIGGHAFPRLRSTTRKCVTRDSTFLPQESSRILIRCKQEGVTVQNAIFAASALAWSRAQAEKPSSTINPEHPIMMYTAANLRSYLPPATDIAKGVPESHSKVAIGYFNVSIPFAASEEQRRSAALFWTAARSARDQGRQALSHPMFLSRNVEMGRERGERARAFAVQDDALAAGRPAPSLPPPQVTATSPGKPPAHPSTALLGLSLMGALDPLYQAHRFPGIQLDVATCGTRKGPGGLLLFVHSLSGRLFMGIGWDSNGFPKGVVELFGEHLEAIIREFMLDDSTLSSAPARL